MRQFRHKTEGGKCLVERGEVNGKCITGLHVANYGRENLRACLIRQCLRRAVPRVVGRVRIFRQAAVAERSCPVLSSHQSLQHLSQL